MKSFSHIVTVSEQKKITVVVVVVAVVVGDHFMTEQEMDLRIRILLSFMVCDEPVCRVYLG